MTIGQVAGCCVGVSEDGVLFVRTAQGKLLSVLPKGTHAALNQLGQTRKAKIVKWWKANR